MEVSYVMPVFTVKVLRYAKSHQRKIPSEDITVLNVHAANARHPNLLKNHYCSINYILSLTH